MGESELMPVRIKDFSYFQHLLLKIASEKITYSGITVTKHTHYLIGMCPPSGQVKQGPVLVNVPVLVVGQSQHHKNGFPT